MEKIELNIVKTPLDPHGRERSGAELRCSPLWTGKVMLVGFLLHEGRIVLGPRFDAFLKSVSCCSVPTWMFPQKQECKIKWAHTLYCAIPRWLLRSAGKIRREGRGGLIFINKHIKKKNKRLFTVYLPELPLLGRATLQKDIFSLPLLIGNNFSW